MSARLSASACEAADSPPDEDGPAVLIALASTKLRAVLAVDYVTFLVFFESIFNCCPATLHVFILGYCCLRALCLTLLAHYSVSMYTQFLPIVLRLGIFLQNFRALHLRLISTL